MSRPKEGSDSSIVDRIIKEEVQEIKKTLNETLKVKQEIAKRQNILKASKDKEKLQELNVLDNKKATGPKTPLMNFYMTPLFLGCTIGAIGLVISIFIILIVLRRRKSQQPEKRDETKETENPDDSENR
ncbi:hypothetical protein RF11_03995 [Thelohanellus kitauei]|uniref:Uncharacterized protein n=1 Tax=Thelohanellus kitauei TaxID=669202 RepID=A0A0C2I6D9_THEKT|nr:hypothetical protein RF11_03995 [Thelohanellus kitauei]